MGTRKLPIAVPGRAGCWIVDFGDGPGILAIDPRTVRDYARVGTDPNPERRRLGIACWKQRNATAIADAGYDRAVRGSRREG